MRYFVIGINSENEKSSWQAACNHLPFVQVVVSPPPLLAYQARLEAEILPHYFVHEAFGGRPVLGRSQILPTYGVRGHAPWVISIPPLPYSVHELLFDEDEDDDEEPEIAPTLTPARRTELTERLSSELEAVFRALEEFDLARRGTLSRIGLHTTVAFASYDLLDDLPQQVAAILARHEAYFAVESSAPELPAAVPEVDPVTAVREWFARYSFAQVFVAEQEISELDRLEWYKLVEALWVGGWLVVELAARTSRLTLFLKCPRSATVHVVRDEEWRAACELSVEGSTTIVAVRQSLVGTLLGSWIYSEGAVRFVSGYL